MAVSAATNGERRRSVTQPARVAAVATAILVVVGFGFFGLLVVSVSNESHISPWQAIFGPLPGNPLIVWLYYFVPAMALQGAVALALHQRATWIRGIGVLGALAFVVFCSVWFAAAAYGLIVGVAKWLSKGTYGGDVGDAIGIVAIGVPLGLALLLLNLRAALQSIRPPRGNRGLDIISTIDTRRNVAIESEACGRAYLSADNRPSFTGGLALLNFGGSR